jgi:site-specific DNA recombinase
VSGIPRQLAGSGRADTKRKAVLYARVSSKEQEVEGYSIPSQIKTLRSYAGANDLGVVHEFVDVETAKQAGRTAFGEMVSFLRRNHTCRAILVEKTDRLYRNFKDYVILDELDLEVHLVKENTIFSDNSRSTEKFMHGIKVLMAKNYIDNLSEETRKGMQEKAEQGIWPSFAPLGYLNVVGPSGKKIIEPDPELSPIITRTFERYSNGDVSIKEVAKQARADGLNFRKSKAPVSTAMVHKILRSRIYMGDFDWVGRTYQGTHLPLVGRELWERVQAILDGRNAKRKKKAKHSFAFSGLVSCGHCGCALVGELKKRKYVYYHCTGYKGKCPEPYTREEVLEEQFAAVLQKLTFDEEIADWVAEALRQSHAEKQQYREAAIVRLRSEHDRLQSRIDSMYIDKLDGRIDATFFDSKAKQWRAEQNRCLSSIEEHQSADETYIEEGVQLLELARRAHALFRRQKPHEKRRLLNFVLSNSTWRDGQLTVEFRQPFDLLVVGADSNGNGDAGSSDTDGRFDNWLPGKDLNLD